VGLVTALSRFFVDQGVSAPDPDRTFLWLDFVAVDQHAPQDVRVLLLITVVINVLRVVCYIAGAGGAGEGLERGAAAVGEMQMGLLDWWFALSSCIF
jgi:hypothetical protein